MRPGKRERKEARVYSPRHPNRRHRLDFEIQAERGGFALIASFDVASGQVVKATVGDTRTEADYLGHVQRLIATDPNATKWHLVMDCLNTHQSESLVRFVAQIEGLKIDLGVKGESGILTLVANSIRLFAYPQS